MPKYSNDEKSVLGFSSPLTATIIHSIKTLNEFLFASSRHTAHAQLGAYRLRIPVDRLPKYLGTISRKRVIPITENTNIIITSKRTMFAISIYKEKNTQLAWL